jgi:hypothetical protein
MRFLLLLLFSSSVLALKPHIATYTLSASDFKIGKEVRTLHKEKKKRKKVINIIRMMSNFQFQAEQMWLW